jgi:glycosyltransferase involved in cell wall biosynthesis
VLPNPTPPLPELPERVHGDRPLLAFAGRMTAPKALGVALDAVAEVPEVDLVLAGDGDERVALEARARELGLDGRVRFVGSLPRDEVLSLFRSADAALLSSAWENFPHTLVEALAVGTPAIATSVGGVPEIVTHGENGLLVPPGDPAALAAAIRRFLADDALRARLTAAAAPSAERFSAERIYGRLEAILVGAAGA